MNDRWIVITTINPPSEAMRTLIDTCEDEWSIVVVGDEKTPSDWEVEPVHYLSLRRQIEMFPRLASLAPVGHYCRKNLGYLFAIRHGARCILETDDDNTPYRSFGRKLSPRVSGRLLAGDGWANVYRHFCTEQIWPRGLPLDAIDQAGERSPRQVGKFCPIQQFLVDGDPDVDAIFRLVFSGRTVNFNPLAESVILEPGTWSPFNSQNTLFFEPAFPALFLPHHVSFRMTDIWRSFVAQALLWVYGQRIAFHTSTAHQNRNPHCLRRDFEQEVIGYLSNARIADSLMSEVSRLASEPEPTVAETAMTLWKNMIEINVVPRCEQPLIEGWFGELQEILARRRIPKTHWTGARRVA